MNLLVTGGGGFVGSAAVRHFASRGRDVIALDNLSREQLLGRAGGPIPKGFNWEGLAGIKNVDRVKADIRDGDEVRKAVADVDAILHAAAQVAVTASLEDPRTDFEVNLLGTLNILEAARRSPSDPAVLFCSTNKVYGGNVNRVPVREEGSRYVYDDSAHAQGIPEDFPIDHTEHTPYGVSKLAADLYVQDYARTYGLRTAVFRMSCIYGEGQSGTEDQGWVAHFVLSILRGRPLTIYGDGKQVRDVLHVADLVRVYEAALETPAALEGGVFNVGGGPRYTLSLLELVDLVEERTGQKANLTFADWRPGDQKVYVSDITRVAEVLEWKPRIAPPEGIERLLTWVRSELGL